MLTTALLLATMQLYTAHMDISLVDTCLYDSVSFVVSRGVADRDLGQE